MTRPPILIESKLVGVAGFGQALVFGSAQTPLGPGFRAFARFLLAHPPQEGALSPSNPTLVQKQKIRPHPVDEVGFLCWSGWRDFSSPILGSPLRARSCALRAKLAFGGGVRPRELDWQAREHEL
jgi:hypothetical protein